MVTEISPETITPLHHNQIPVITTELLAKLYGTEVNNIRKNHSRNHSRFIEGKHYFLLEGSVLRDLKNRVSLGHSVRIARNARSLILWTERGAARHAKMLETEQAWEVFERLEDCYFGELEGKPLSPRYRQSNSSGMLFNEMAITQLNVMFKCVENLRMNMWPHLSAILPGLNREYSQTFVTLAMVFSLLKKEREDCKREAERAIRCR